MRRSQVGGVNTSEFSAGGGYAAVKKLAEGNTTGYQAGVSTVADRAKYAPNDAIVRFDPAGQGGLGETFYASGNSATGGAATAATEAVGYTGLTGANKGDAVAADRLSGYSLPTTRALIELSTGRKMDSSFYDPTNPNYAANQAVLNRANMAMYGDVGANLDARNWNAIMAAADPLKAAEDALKAMYSDKAYLAANTDRVLAQGYLPEQADLTYKQMATRVGSAYDPNWSKGTKYEGKYDTTSYLNNTKNLSGDAPASYEDSLWTKWGGNPVKKKGVVDTTATTTTPTNTPLITTPTVFTPPIVGKATGSATTTPGKTTQLNAPIASGGAGLITGANTLASTPGTFNIANTATGNVNAGGLITGAQQQMFTENAQVGLPTGVTPTIGAMGNNTGGASIEPYNPYKFTGASTATGTSQNWYNPKTGQRYTAPAGTWTPPSTDWTKY